MKILDWLKERAAERSTWIGITAFLTAVGITIDPTQAEAIATAGVALSGAIAAFTKG